MAEPEEDVAENATPYVLVVDDVDANLQSMQAVLESIDCRLILANSGNQALRQLLKHEFAVMLLDVQMPEMDGYEVAQHARRNPATRDLPVIFLTAATHTAHGVARGYDAGAVDYLFKPIDPTILRAKVRVFLDLYKSRLAISRVNERLRAKNQELLEAQRELRETQSQLVHTAKMASIGSLVAGVAHEVNNPLAFIMNHLGTVRHSLGAALPEGLVLPEGNQENWDRAQTRLAEIEGGVRRIREIVIKLRTFSRKDEGEPAPLDLAECVDSVLTMLRHRFEDRIEVTVDLQAQASLDGYPGLINQALMNLLSNAIDAIEGSGTIHIESRDEPGHVVLTVTDSGAGIPSELKDRILDPFFTTKPVGAGTGLGLSITYSIVQRHSGHLEFLEAAGGGTSVVLRLPRARH